jgi:PAS domain S-box-containing protein
MLQFALVSLTAGIITFTGLAAFAWRQRRRLGPLGIVGCGWSLGLAMWLALFGYEAFGPNDALAFALFQARWFTAQVIVVLSFLFSVFFAGYRAQLRRAVLLLLAAIPLISLVLIIANEHYHTLWAAHTIHTFAGLRVMRVTPGLWYGVFQSGVYLVYVAGIGLMFMRLVSLSAVYRQQLIFLVPATALPLVTALLYAADATPFDLTPFVLVLSGLAVAWALLRHQLFDLLPVARSRMIDSLDDGMLVLDAAERVITYNPAVARLVAWPTGDVTGRPLASANSVLAAHISPHLHQAAGRPVEVQFDAPARWLEVHITPLEEFGRTAGYLLIVHDISERRRAEHALQEALAREKELSQLKSRFVSLVSHEFRTPMSIIQTSTDLLKMRLARMKLDVADDKLDVIGLQVQYMATLMDEVLSLERIQTGRMKFEPVRQDVVGVCQQIISELNTPDSKRLALTLPDPPLEMDVDKRLLRLILHNLLSNALKYSPADTPVHCQLVLHTDGVQFEVTDHGIGIPEDEQPCLFEPFHRASNVGSTPGTGLGLSIVKHAVDLHGGRLALTSRPGEGTSLRVWLPLSQQPMPSQPALA